MVIAYFLNMPVWLKELLICVLLSWYIAVFKYLVMIIKKRLFFFFLIIEETSLKKQRKVWKIPRCNRDICF